MRKPTMKAAALQQAGRKQLVAPEVEPRLLNIGDDQLGVLAVQGTVKNALSPLQAANAEATSRFNFHMANLRRAGLEGFYQAGSIKLNGRIRPSIGVFYPALMRAADGQSLEIFTSRTEIGSARTIVSSGLGDPLRTRKVRTGSVVHHLPSVTSRFAFGAIASIFPAGESYIVCDELDLSGSTTILLDSRITNLTILAKAIYADASGFDITWDAAPVAAAIDPGPPGVAHSGQPGRKGNPGNGGNDGAAAPNVEIWTLGPITDRNGGAVSDPLRVFLSGQNGGKGSIGQRGQMGGHGEAGVDSESDRMNLFCRSGPTSGQRGAVGGNGGIGGKGGRGGNGGELAIYAPQPSVSGLAHYYSDTILSNDGGHGGDGGDPGLPGHGGDGGPPGRILGPCSNHAWEFRDRVQGPRGPAGNAGDPGIRGPDGNSGGAIKLNIIDETIFDQFALRPAVFDRSPVSLQVGERFTIEGLNFSAGDRMTVLGVEYPCDFTDETPTLPQRLSTLIPDIEGGPQTFFVQSTALGKSNIETFFVRANIELVAPALISAGETIHIHGTGFYDGIRVFVDNEELLDVTYVDKNNIHAVMQRPLGVASSASQGELVRVTTVDSQGHRSDPMEVTLKTMSVYYLGDSIMAGQGLDHLDTFQYGITQHLRQMDPDRGIYEKRFAHSGATMEYHEDSLGDASWHREIPRALPTIHEQLDAALADRLPWSETCFVINGGINDVKASTWLKPNISPAGHFVTMAKIRSLAYQFGYQSMKRLLDRIATEVPEARVIVAGYYQIISDQSFGGGPNLQQLIERLAGMPGMLFVWQTAAMNNIARQSDHLTERLNAGLQRSVDEVNAQYSTSNFTFVDPAFGPENAVFAPNSWLFELGPMARADDPNRSVRVSACNIVYEPNEVGARAFCWEAGAAHPNAAGTQQYLQRIANVL